MLERRVYTEEFKRDAVRLAQERGNIRATAQDLGVSETVLSRWKRAMTENTGNPFPGQGNPRAPELARLERENIRLREENAILKKNSGHLCQRPQLKYQYIQQQRDKFSLAALCRAMRVSESGYRAWSQRKPSRREQSNQTLMERIRSLFDRSGETYGSRRITDDLHEAGECVNRKRVARLMSVAGLKVRPPRRFTVTTDSEHALPVAENTLDREFTCLAPNAKWTADITYIWTSEGWLYLAVVLDLFSRRVVGGATGATLERSLVIVALEQAERTRKPPSGLLCHSDRGSQYASHDYQKRLQEAGIVCSMSRKGNCWDNAPTESFFATLKKELVHRVRFATRGAAHRAVFAWIEIWYNRKRKHSTLGYLSPEAFERKYRAEQQTMKMVLA